jgi:hypothetical protein
MTYSDIYATNRYEQPGIDYIADSAVDQILCHPNNSYCAGESSSKRFALHEYECLLKCL